LLSAIDCKTACHPTGRNIFEITNATHPEHGNLMSKTLQIIAYAKCPRITGSCSK